MSVGNFYKFLEDRKDITKCMIEISLYPKMDLAQKHWGHQVSHLRLAALFVDGNHGCASKNWQSLGEKHTDDLNVKLHKDANEQQ